jgi:tetratricopeptide (TPR) repeat protein
MNQTFWTAVGALGTVASVVAAVYIGLRQPETVPPQEHPIPQGKFSKGSDTPMPEVAAKCLGQKLPACGDNVNSIAVDIASSCRTYLKSDPNSPLAYSLIGRANRALGQLGEAEAAFQMQLQLGQSLNDRNTISQAYFNLASIHMRRKALDPAEKYARMSLELAASNATAQAANYKILGDVYYQREDFVQADTHLSRSAELYQESDDRLSLGGVLTGLGFTKLRKRDRLNGCFYLRKARDVLSETAFLSASNTIERQLLETRC